MAIRNFSLGFLLFVVIISAAFLSGCAAPERLIVTETVVEKIPVPIPVAIPPELSAMVVYDLPVFIRPVEPTAAVALTKGDAEKLRQLLFDLKARVDLWQNWAASQSGSVK